jgi:HEAT repeat protein
MTQELMSIVDDESLQSERDLKAMAILSLGLMKEGHEDIVKFLLKVMNDRSLDRIVKAQAPIALGKLHELSPEGSSFARGALATVVDMFQDDKADNDLRRSLAVCIGMLANMSDVAAMDALMDAVAKSNDDQTRHFGIMGLAQIGARDTTPADHQEAHAKLEDFMLRELTKPKRITHQPYGALGLAVYARNENIAGFSTRAGEKILEALLKTNNPSYLGAMAVSLGLLNYKPAQDSLWTMFEESNDQPLQGYIAVALGLMRATTKADQFRSLIQKKGLEFKFRLQLARALGLMGDVNAVETLISYLEQAETLSETSSCAQALGLIGDKSAVDPLLAIVRNQSKQALQRGFSCVALGIIGEKTDLPWNVIFSVNSNYRAKVPALSEILDIL